MMYKVILQKAIWGGEGQDSARLVRCVLLPVLPVKGMELRQKDAKQPGIGDLVDEVGVVEWDIDEDVFRIELVSECVSEVGKAEERYYRQGYVICPNVFWPPVWIDPNEKENDNGVQGVPAG